MAQAVSPDTKEVISYRQGIYYSGYQLDLDSSGFAVEAALPGLGMRPYSSDFCQNHGSSTEGDSCGGMDE